MRDYGDDRDRHRDDRRRSEDNGDGILDDLIETLLLYIVLPFVGILIVTGVLDNFFGWGLTNWVMNLVGLE